jgi:hypothetical protein
MKLARREKEICLWCKGICSQPQVSFDIYPRAYKLDRWFKEPHEFLLNTAWDTSQIGVTHHDGTPLV